MDGRREGEREEGEEGWVGSSGKGEGDLFDLKMLPTFNLYGKAVDGKKERTNKKV